MVCIMISLVGFRTKNTNGCCIGSCGRWKQGQMNHRGVALVGQKLVEAGSSPLFISPSFNNNNTNNT